VARENRELFLAKSSFTTDARIYEELDGIAGTDGAASYDREVFVEFLHRKEWVIEETAEG